MKQLFTIVLVLCLIMLATAKEVVQFSGYIRDADSYIAVPYAAIYVKNLNRGTISGPDGFFNFVIGKGDTLIVKSLGYKSFTLIISEDIDGTVYSKDIFIEQQTIEIKGVVVRPLPEPHQLRQAILNLDIPDNLAELAQQTIANSVLNDEFEQNIHYDGAENYNLYAKQQATYYYNRFGNQRPGISLTDPFAWANFVKYIKDKRKK